MDEEYIFTCVCGRHLTTETEQCKRCYALGSAECIRKGYCARCWEETEKLSPSRKAALKHALRSSK